MPSKYVVRRFTEDSIYHVFNKGTEGRSIFSDEKDYKFFQIYLFIYLQPIEEILKKYPDVPPRLHKKNLSKEVALLGYCLMPNHFHLLLKQKTRDGISKLMKQLTNAYTLFFNQKNKRSGSLFQGRFKAVELNQDNLKHLLCFIHLEPGVNNYPWSSYADYLKQESDLPCSKEEVLSLFPSLEDFEKFHKDTGDHTGKLEKIKHLTIE